MLMGMWMRIWIKTIEFAGDMDRGNAYLALGVGASRLYQNILLIRHKDIGASSDELNKHSHNP